MIDYDDQQWNHMSCNEMHHVVRLRNMQLDAVIWDHLDVVCNQLNCGYYMDIYSAMK